MIYILRIKHDMIDCIIQLVYTLLDEKLAVYSSESVIDEYLYDSI